MSATFKRYAPGLYVDPTGTWVITRDREATGSYLAYYTVRELTGIGLCSDGVTMMPDYDDMIWYEASSLAQAKSWVTSRVVLK